MEPPDYQVIVVRAWREAGGLRIRLIAHGDSERHWVVGSIAEASALSTARGWTTPLGDLQRWRVPALGGPEQT